MFKNKFYNDVLKAVLIISAILVLCKVTGGGMAILVAVAGAGYAMQRKAGELAICYMMFPVFTSFNRVIVGLNSVFLMTSRLGNLFLISAMMLTGAGFHGRVRERLPILWLFAYCIVACVSSIGGWMPLISFLKLTQYVFFLTGLLFVTRILQQSDLGLYKLRCAFMAVAVIFILGSAIAHFIPSIGYSMNLSYLQGYGYDIIADEMVESESMVLFNGMTEHSQMLAPVLSMMSAWVICDMLLVEKRMTMLHGGLLAITPVMLYMSRSRGGLLELVAIIAMSMFVCVPRARLAKAVKSKLSTIMFAIVAVLSIAMIVGQIRTGAISRWLRKTDDVHADTRSLKEAFTGSRQRLIESNLNDFRQNPLLGTGFQVTKGMDRAYRAGRITFFTASVEKGVTPYVVLGETGIIGAIVFAIFLVSFYSTCVKRRYLALMTMFTCMFVANLADSTFFSPGGTGGFLWISSCIGGFGIDLIAIKKAHGAWFGPDGKPSFPPHMFG